MLNTAQISQLLKPGLAAIVGVEYDGYEDQWREIYDIYESDKAQEIEQEMRLLTLGQIRPEGSATAFDTPSQRFTTTYIHKYVGLGFQITRQAMLDNLYKSHFPMQAKALRHSLRETKNVLGAAVLNNAFNANFPIADGQPLCSSSHPIDFGTVANTPNPAQDLNEASLEQAIIAIQQFKDQAGLFTGTKPTKLIVPAQGQFVAERLLASAFRVGTPNNDVNALYNMSMIPEGFRVNQYLTGGSGNQWYLLTNCDNGFKHYVREKVETDMYVDFQTDNLMAKAVERYSFGVSNFRSVYGSNGP